MWTGEKGWEEVERRTGRDPEADGRAEGAQYQRHAVEQRVASEQRAEHNMFPVHRRNVWTPKRDPPLLSTILRYSPIPVTDSSPWESRVTRERTSCNCPRTRTRSRRWRPSARRDAPSTTTSSRPARSASQPRCAVGFATAPNAQREREEEELRANGTQQMRAGAGWGRGVTRSVSRLRMLHRHAGAGGRRGGGHRLSALAPHEKLSRVFLPHRAAVTARATTWTGCIASVLLAPPPIPTPTPTQRPPPSSLRDEGCGFRTAPHLRPPPHPPPPPPPPPPLPAAVFATVSPTELFPALSSLPQTRARVRRSSRNCSDVALGIGV